MYIDRETCVIEVYRDTINIISMYTVWLLYGFSCKLVYLHYPMNQMCNYQSKPMHDVITKR